MTTSSSRHQSHRLLILASVVIMLASVIIASQFRSPSLTLPVSANAPLPTPTPQLITSASRPPKNQSQLIIDIHDVVIGDSYGPVRLRELKPADTSYSATPQTDNLALTFQGQIKVPGILTPDHCLLADIPLPLLPESSGPICFGTTKLISQTTIGVPIEIILDNYTLTLSGTSSHRSATYLSSRLLE